MDLDAHLTYCGKVRDVYDFGDNLLLRATNRVSAFDQVIPTIIAGKGKLLNKISLFWFELLKDVCPSHLITGNFDEFPSELKEFAFLRDRSMLVKKAERIDIECIARGYLAGSAWKEYCESQTVWSNPMPKGLKESSKLPEPLFTPTTKEDEYGHHDENIPFEEVERRIGKAAAEKIRDYTLKLYKIASDFAMTKGIIIADSKLEFGFYDGQIILIDEAFTPDSSRLWEVKKYEEGKHQDSLDKQYVRDYLELINWDKVSFPPELSKPVVNKTREKYVQVYEKLTGDKMTWDVFDEVGANEL